MPKVTPHHKLMRRFSDPASFHQRTEVDLSGEVAMSLSSPTTPIDEHDIDLVNLQAQNEADLTDDQQLRRPMNAFLLFCKRHRGIVKQKHPWLDNRSCTKMLADMWAVLDPDEKNRYLQLARECKAAFMKAHPDYKWCGTSRHKSSPGACSGASRKLFPMQDVSKLNLSMIAKEGITVGKLADPESMGGLSMLLLAGQHAMVKPDNSSISKDVMQEIEDEEEPVSPTSTLFQLAEMCSDRLPLSVMLKKKEKEQTASKMKLKILNSSTKSEQNEDDSNLHGSAKKKKRKSEKGIPSIDKKDNITNKDASDYSNSRDEEFTKKVSKMKSKGKKRKKSKSKDKETENKESIINEQNAIGIRDEDGVNEENGLNSPSEELETQDIDTNDDSKMESDTDRVSEDGSGIPRRRKSSRSCKGRLYREFVMEGMLETLQRQERPFNCKKTWRHENTTYTDEEDMIFEQEVEKWKKTSRKRPRRRTISGSGSCNIDYGEINIEAKLAALPQLSMDQFRPKTKAQRSKKSAKMYKNAMFFRKEAKERAKAKENAMMKPRKCEPEITGSRKRKANKSSIIHLVPRSEDGSKEDACHGSSGGISDAETGQDDDNTEISNPYHKFSLTDLAEVASRESKPCSSNVVKVSVHKSTSSGVISSASIHRPPLMVP